MPRSALSRLALAIAASAALNVPAPSSAADPHLDVGLLPQGCQSCHRGHGASRSPMLPQAQKALCLSCHGTRADVDKAIRQGRLAAGAQPTLLGSVLTQPYGHPIHEAAFSRHERESVTCTSCHSPHRGVMGWAGGGLGAGGQKLSPKGDGTPEYQLCQSCHGSEGGRTRRLTDISRLFDPSSRSFHPVQAPVRDGAPSLTGRPAGSLVNCTDCHGSNDPRAPRGPHGSSEPFLLKARHPTVDGGGESELCYRCHDRKAVLDSPNFPEHELHVVKARAACATCHNAHGSVENRALIRFGEEFVVSGIAPGKGGRVSFVSNSPGAGTCFLSCHGKDHGAEQSYGAGRLHAPEPTSMR